MVQVDGRSHPNVVKLNEIKEKLSYLGWEKDFRDAEDAHKERSYSTDFPKALRKLKVKQKMHEGDRSHPRLVALDAFVQMGLDYPGWQADVQQLEKMHAEVPYLERSDIAYSSKLKALEYSQLMYSSTGKSHEEDKKENRAALSSSNSMENCSVERTSNPLGLCSICGDEARSHAFIPCGHLVACQECASKVMRRSPRCPMCRCSAIETVEIFL